MKAKDYKGSITIYLALIFTIMLSLVLIAIEGSRQQAIMLKLECGFDSALTSIFGQFHKELLEQYDLFFIDTSYGEKEGSLNNTKEMFGSYLEDNFHGEASPFSILTKDFYDLEVEDLEVLQYTKAVDHSGDVFKRQAVEYIKNYYGVAYFDQVKSQLESSADADLLTRDITKEREDNQSAIDAVEIPPREIGEGEFEEIPLENPADGVNGSRNIGILALVTEKDAEISREQVCLEHYISHRNYIEGDGYINRKETSTLDDIFYQEYILKKCSSYTNPLEKSQMKYQVEYVIAGKDNDIDNLTYVVNQLLLVREVANFTHIMSDSVKLAQAEALALSLAAVIAAPQLEQLVKLAIVFAWAYAESVYDVKQLLAGKKIPMIKDSTNFHFSLEGMLNYSQNLDDVSSGGSAEGDAGETSLGLENGLDYTGYLRIMLTTVSNKNSIFRMMDIVEMDIRKTLYNQYFAIDQCIDYIKIKGYVTSIMGNTLEIEREQYYF